MLLRWLNKQRFDASRPASGRLPAGIGQTVYRKLLSLSKRQRKNFPNDFDWILSF